MKWECHNGMVSSNPAKLKDTDLACDGPCARSSIEKCEGACVTTADCVMVNWHISDKHCHIYTGTGMAHDAFVASLTYDTARDACMLVSA
jgi:hypothetical protein